MNVQPIKTRIFTENENLIDFIVEQVPRVEENSILVVTSKIAALAEGRTKVVKSSREKEALIKEESDWALPTKYVWLTLKDGHLMPTAGIDESNADGAGKLILLPRDCYSTARALRATLLEKYNVKNLGIIITDSRTLPLRQGTIGEALGYAGFEGLKKYRGERDLFGRPFKFARVNIADSLAAAAVLTMGEGQEQQPLALITNAGITFNAQAVNKDTLKIDPEDDMYRPFFTELVKPSRIPRPVRYVFNKINRKIFHVFHKRL